MLPSVDWSLVPEVSGQPIGAIFKGFPEKSVTNYQPTLRNIPEERRFHLHRDGSLRILTKFNLELLSNQTLYTALMLTCA
jgi:hypothetical protein